MAFSRSNRFSGPTRRSQTKKATKENRNSKSNVIRGTSARAKRALRRQKTQQDDDRKSKKRKSSAFGGTTSRFGGRGSIYKKSSAPADALGMAHKESFASGKGVGMKQQKGKRFGHGSYLGKDQIGEGDGKMASVEDLDKAKRKKAGGPKMDDPKKRRHRRFSMAGSHFGTLGEATKDLDKVGLALDDWTKRGTDGAAWKQDEAGRDGWMGVDDEEKRDEGADNLGLTHGDFELKTGAKIHKAGKHRRFSMAGSYIKEAEGAGAGRQLSHAEGLYGTRAKAGPSMGSAGEKSRFERHDSHLNAGHDKDAVGGDMAEHEDLGESLAKKAGGKINPIVKHSRMSMVGSNFATGGGTVGSVLATVTE